jgi:uncharacterized membrane protein
LLLRDETLNITKSRFEAFTDGVFAIAITLLILELRVQNLRGAGEAAQWRELLAQSETFLVYVVAFGTIGIFWVNHHAMFKNVTRITLAIAILNLVFLLVVCFVPFVMHVMGAFGTTRPAVILYGVTLSVLSLLYNLLWHEAWRSVHGQDGRTMRHTAWNIVGLLAYPAATLIALEWPRGAVIAFFLLTCFYAMPRNVRAAIVPLPSETKPA